MKGVNIFWFRRDLRLNDNCGLYHALKSGQPVLPIFIFDPYILDKLENKMDARLQFIHNALEGLKDELTKYSSTLEVFYGKPEMVFEELIEKYSVSAVFTNHDYEKYPIERDCRVESLLINKGIAFHDFKDQVIFEKNEIVKENEQAYTIFTPYSRKWKEKLTPFYLSAYDCEKYFHNFHRQTRKEIPSLKSMGFVPSDIQIPSIEISDEIIQNYALLRDYPSKYATSRIGIHLRFGTLSIRTATSKAFEMSPVFLNELIWRDFYQCILWHFPHISNGKAFKPKYDLIQWRNDEKEFERWCSGSTGYPIVDAGMRELNTTGFMHNRVRMIVASFLSKHLLIDWRWGEAYFAEKLLDYEFASNNGGWQWAAGSGCDAAPYFRIFNPWLQSKKFDAGQEYIRKWVPEFDEPSYPEPIVVHEFARNRCLEVYKKSLGEEN